jgi:hypothetical protein
MSYHWPGNVRELKNAVERAVIMSRGTTIGPSDIIPRHLRNGGGMPAALTIAVGATAAEARQQLVLRTFASTSGDASRTAKVLGLSEREVRGELLSIVTGEAPSQGRSEPSTDGKAQAAAAPARPLKKKEPTPPPRPPAKKPTAKKGR